MAGKGIYIQGTSNAVLGASATKTPIEVIGSTVRLLTITRVRVSQDTHKTSEQYEVHVTRMTTTGTGTAYTPMLKEPNAGASAATAKVADSVEPTYVAAATGDLATARWNSLTGKDIVYPMGSEFYVAPSASTGFGIQITTPASTTNFSPVAEYEGQEIG